MRTAHVESGARATTPVTYYRRGGVQVTDGWLVVDGRRYPVAELDNPRTVRGPRDAMTVSAGATAAVIAVVIAMTAGSFGPTGWIGAGFVLVTPLVVAAVGLARRPRPFELWADYHGLAMQLFLVEDKAGYHQIRRAMVHATAAAPA
jgi:hypothetical protein